MADVVKPEYRVPNMAEIREVPWNGLTVASTFSGCGGSSLGYRMAGFRVVYANEFVEEARHTYRANAAEYTHLDARDIRTVRGQEIIDAAGGVEIDLFDGSPPCSAFSTAGKRESGWGQAKAYSDDKKQVIDDLFFEYARLVREVRPKTFVAENVSGLVKGTAKGYFKLILKELRECGYRVEAKLLNAAWLGVPQARQRLIFVGVREDLPFAPPFPKPLPYQYTVREAICPDVPVMVVYDTHGQFSVVDTTDRPANTITTATNAHMHVFGGSTEPIERDPETGQNLLFTKYSIYEAWKRLGWGSTPPRKHFNLTRVHPDRPCATVTAAGGGIGVAAVAHWETPRKFTLAECRRLCGFPDDFQLTGTFAQRWERLGRAVPPVMMSYIAAAVRDALLENA